MNVLKLKATIIHIITNKIGINFVIVTILLIKAAVSTPFNIKKCTLHNNIDATMILGNVLPPLNIGKKFPIEDINNVAYATLPKKAENQYPQALANPIKSPKPA